MRRYQHKDSAEYLAAQLWKNRKKLKRVYACKEEIAHVFEAVRAMGGASFGICEGVRNGWEVAEFRRILGIEVIGTDIAQSVLQFPNCVVHDFHEQQPEWASKADFVYSNALDHAMEPERCIMAWLSYLKPTGECFIGWEEKCNQRIDAADCFAASFSEFESFLGGLAFLRRVVPIRSNYSLFVITSSGSPRRIPPMPGD